MIAFTETGHTNSDETLEIPGFKLIACNMRVHDAEHGGVAVYAKNHIARRASVVKDLPEYGMVWVKIEGVYQAGTRDIFLCTCCKGIAHVVG